MTEEEKNNLVEKEIIKRIDYILDKANYLDFEGKKEYISFKREYLQDLFDLCKKQQKEIEKLKTDKKNASEYIREEMYVDENPTLDDDNTITELPISLSLCNEDLRKLLELLEDK